MYVATPRTPPTATVIMMGSLRKQKTDRADKEHDIEDHKQNLGKQIQTGGFSFYKIVDCVTGTIHKLTRGVRRLSYLNCDKQYIT